MPVRTLILDIETMPNEVYTWGLFDQNIAINQIKKPGGVMCWAAKWAGSDETYFSSVDMTDPKSMLREIWLLLDQADEVIGWNSNSFDLKILNAEFAQNGFGPPSPYKKIDLMRTVKAHMRFTSNKLDFISQCFGVGKKTEHEGFMLWVSCMKGEADAWEKMEEYNINDVLLTEEMYDKLLPWISTGVNRSVIQNGIVCPVCGSPHVQKRGTAITAGGLSQRYQCRNVGCGAWSKGEKIPRDKVQKLTILK